MEAVTSKLPIARPVLRAGGVCVLQPVPSVRLPPGRADAWIAALLASLAALLFLGRLPCGLLEPEEARHAEIARQMLVQGRWLLPVWHGEDYLHKPPLLYWLIMLSYGVFGVHDWAARLVPCLAGIGLTLVVHFWARPMLGRRAALAAALVLLLSGRFLYLQGMVLFDALLALWVTLALACGHVALHGRRFSEGLWLTSAVACGLGVLTKGPVAVALIAPPLACMALQHRRPARVGPWAAYAMAMSLIAAPWFVYLALSRWDAFCELLWVHHVRRFVEPFDHVEPWWFFLPALAVGMLPWSLWGARGLWTALAWAWSERRSSARPRPSGRRALGGRRVLAFWLAGVWCVLFFSLSGCKRAAYIAPGLPPLAIAVGYLVSRTRWVFPRGRSEAAPTRRGLLLFGGMFVGLAMATLAWLPRYHARFGMREPLSPVRHLPGTAVFSFPRHWDSLSFYLRRGEREFDASETDDLFAELRREERAWLVVRRRDYQGLAAVWPSDLVFHQQRPEHGNVVVGLVMRK